MPSLEIDPRVLGQRIAEARKARGKTQEEVAAFLGVSRPTYIAVEKGDRAAKPDEIIKLAAFFGRKVHELVRPGEPDTGLQPHLRAVADKMKEGDQTGLNAAIDQLQALAEDYRELERVMNAPLRPSYPPEVVLNPKIDPAEQAEVVAEQERKRLGLGDQPVIYLRSTLEWDVGLRIFLTGDLPSNIAGMYAYSTELGVCLLINRKHPSERRRVSMLHEYGHFLLSTDRYKPGIDYLTMPGRKPANERFAEAFALSFLMPATSVRQKFHDTVATTGDFQVADLCRMKHFYFVSLEAMTPRIEQLGLIPKGTWEHLKESGFAQEGTRGEGRGSSMGNSPSLVPRPSSLVPRPSSLAPRPSSLVPRPSPLVPRPSPLVPRPSSLPPREAEAMLGLPSQPIDDSTVPERYKLLAVHAYQRDEIGDSDLAHYLRCDLVTAREIVEWTLTSREVEPSGEERAFKMDFPRSLLSETR